MTAPIAHLGAGDLTTATVTNSSTLTAAKPANVADGDLLVAVLMSRNSSGTWDTVPTGWTSIGGQNTSGTIGTFVKAIGSAAGETASDYSWHTTGGAARGGIVIFRVTGANNNSALDAAGTAATSGTSSIVAPAATPAWEDGLLLGVFASHLSSATQPIITAPAGMTEAAGLQIPNNVSTPTATSYLQVAVQTLAAPGSTGSRTATVAPAGSSAAGLLLALRPVPTAGLTMAAATGMTGDATSVLVAQVAMTEAAGMASDGQTPPSVGAVLEQPTALTGTARQTHLAGLVLAQATSMSATAGYGQLNLLTGGLWQPIVMYRQVAGAWVPS